jgi:squalene cyclase
VHESPSLHSLPHSSPSGPFTNPSYYEVNINTPAVDYECVECTSACLQALAAYREQFPGRRDAEISQAVARGRRYILQEQREDGSWYGSWGVCFTYGIWFGVWGLVAAGETYDSCPAIRKACEFLLSKQRENGGWGESHLSSSEKRYADLPGGRSHVVSTSWAVMALVAAGQHARDRRPLDAAARYVVSLQRGDGDWPQQETIGSFSRNCMITYPNYRNIFPLWALGMYRSEAEAAEAAAAAEAATGRAGQVSEARGKQGASRHGRLVMIDASASNKKNGHHGAGGVMNGNSLH